MGKFPSEREVEVRRAEQEMGAVESELFAEMSQLEETAREVDAKLQQVNALAAEVEQGGLRGGELQAISRRLRAAAVPRAAVDGPREQALSARLQALQARKRATDQIRQALQACAAELSRLSDQVAADHVTLEGLERKAREDAALDQQRREESARRAAAASVVTPPVPEAITDPSIPVEISLTTTQAPSPRAAKTQPAARAEGPAGLLGQQEPRSRRVRMQAAIDFESESNFFQGFSTNLSEGGIFVATVQTLPRGTQVDLHFTLPDGHKLDIKGEVRWVREINDQTPDIFPGVGVQFAELPPQAAEVINKFVAAREPMFFPD